MKSQLPDRRFQFLPSEIGQQSHIVMVFGGQTSAHFVNHFECRFIGFPQARFLHLKTAANFTGDWIRYSRLQWLSVAEHAEESLKRPSALLRAASAAILPIAP